MTYCVLDLETTNKTTYKRMANPFDTDNRIVLLGYKIKGQEVVIQNKVDLSFLSSVDVLVGHNIKFDLLYLWDYPRFQEWLANGGRVFDTMIAEYILQAQQATSLKLDELAPKYGGTHKDVEVSTMIKNGICPSTIDQKRLAEYLVGDVENTEIVLTKQFNLLKQHGQLQLAIAVMDSVLTTSEMEYNGLYVNRPRLKELKTKKIYEIVDLENELQKIIKRHWTAPVKFNPASNDHVSVLLFGGVVKNKERVEVLKDGVPETFKTGQNAGKVKTRLENKEYKIDGLVFHNGLTQPVQKAGFYKVDEDVVTKVGNKGGKAGTIARLITQFRSASKELNTYYEGFNKYIDEEGIIHGSLNQTVTFTGRLSSSKPNLQNIPREGTCEFKDVFVSRYPNGVIIEADFKQLEVVAAAFLSKDQILQREMIQGVDIHLANGEWVYGKPSSEISSEERTLVKVQTFQLLYGASAYALAMAVGCTEDEAQGFIDGFYGKYQGVRKWHSELALEVFSSARQIPGTPIREGFYKSITGRSYKFTQFKKKSGEITFNLPDIKNYPVQGFATADIVVAQLGRLYRALQPYREHIKLINTVHDSVLLDCKEEYALRACQLLKDVLECTEWMNQAWNISFNLPLRVDISIGKSWYDLIKYHRYLELNSHKSQYSQV
jgi:DNA polymerase-1